MKLLRELQNIVSEKATIKDRDEWMDAVKKAYPDKADKIRFKGGVEDGKHMFWAHIPGEDRAYGVYDMDDEEGEVLGEGVVREGGRPGWVRPDKRKSTVTGATAGRADFGNASDIPHDLMTDKEVDDRLSDHEFADNLSAPDAVFFMNIFTKRERMKAKRNKLAGNRYKYAFFEIFDTLGAEVRAKLEEIEKHDHGRMNWTDLEQRIKNEDKDILKRKA
jgi:hypothetical protein